MCSFFYFWWLWAWLDVGGLRLLVGWVVSLCVVGLWTLSAWLGFGWLLVGCWFWRGAAICERFGVGCCIAVRSCLLVLNSVG